MYNIGGVIDMENTLYPERAVTNVPVEIDYNEDEISTVFERNDKYIKIMKSLGYWWDRSRRVWYKRINETTGNVEDRVAELGNTLLNEGFPIKLEDAELRERAISGEYEEEHKKWIIKKVYRGTGCFGIIWRTQRDYYDKARSLPSSRWDPPHVVVRLEHYKAVEEFAEFYGFRFTEKAKQSIEDYKKTLEKRIVVKPVKKPEKKEEEPKDGLKEILKTIDDGVLDDLKD